MQFGHRVKSFKNRLRFLFEYFFIFILFVGSSVGFHRLSPVSTSNPTKTHTTRGPYTLYEIDFIPTTHFDGAHIGHGFFYQGKKLSAEKKHFTGKHYIFFTTYKLSKTFSKHVNIVHYKIFRRLFTEHENPKFHETLLVSFDRFEDDCRFPKTVSFPTPSIAPSR